jgi:hypothetical protein
VFGQPVYVGRHHQVRAVVIDVRVQDLGTQIINGQEKHIHFVLRGSPLTENE